MKKFEIVSKKMLAANVNEYVIYAPLASRNCLAGQFVILRTDTEGERVPFTICDYSRVDGTVSILVQEVGATTMKLASMQVGDTLADFVAPLGNATDLTEYKNVLLVAGGIGSAVVYPQCKQLNSNGKNVDVVLGARNKNLLTYMDEFVKQCDNFYAVTDDGSFGKRGFVTDMIAELVSMGKQYDLVFAVGPLMMMKAVCTLTKKLGIKTIVSMNSLMVDGTGMCGCCRLSVDGVTKYACIDGPEFDGHKVDFDEAISRSRMYKEIENIHTCNLRNSEIEKNTVLRVTGGVADACNVKNSEIEMKNVLCSSDSVESVGNLGNSKIETTTVLCSSDSAAGIGNLGNSKLEIKSNLCSEGSANNACDVRGQNGKN